MSFVKEVLKDCKNSLRFFQQKSRWRRKNKNNRTIANTLFDINKVFVGNETYGHLNVHTYGNDQERLEIGNYCSIAGGVHFILSGGHDINKIMTFPFSAYYKNMIDSSTKGKIVIEDDVWIGYGSIILSGVRVGKGAVIGAGSLINKDVPPYAVVGGVPAKIIKYRFSEFVIKKLLEIDFSKINLDTLINIVNYYVVSDSNIDEILEKLKDNCC